MTTTDDSLEQIIADLKERYPRPVASSDPVSDEQLEALAVVCDGAVRDFQQMADNLRALKIESTTADPFAGIVDVEVNDGWDN